MWPFKKKQKTIEDIDVDGVIVRYSEDTEEWDFFLDCHEFTFRGEVFDRSAIAWARDAGESVKTLEKDLQDTVAKCIGEYVEGGDPEVADIVSIDVTDYGTGRRAVVSFAGDDSWGDFGVDVTVEGNAIAEVDAGD